MNHVKYSHWYWIGWLLFLFSCTEDEMPLLSLENPTFSQVDVRNLTLKSKINGPLEKVTEVGFYLSSFPDFRSKDNDMYSVAAYKQPADRIDTVGNFSKRLNSPYEIMFKREKPYYIKAYLVDEQGHEIFSNVIVLYFPSFEKGKIERIENDFTGRIEEYGSSSFAIGDKGYVLGGVLGTYYPNPSKRFFCYDPAANLWEEPSVFPGKPRAKAAAIEINGKGYIGGGFKGNIKTYFPYEIIEPAESLDDLWEYDPEQKQWAARASLPEKGIFIAFEAYEKGYFLKGKNMWEYDPVSNNWTSKLECPIDPISCFAVGEKGYVFQYGNVWEYDPLQNTWKEKAAYPGPVSYQEVRSNAGKGYVFTDNGALVYDPIEDEWSTQNINPFIPNYSGGIINVDINFSFSIQDTLYFNGVYSRTRESFGFYKYMPQ